MHHYAPNLNHLWAQLIVEELVRNGVDLFCLAPGSRSTPLTTAVARHPKARHVMHFDERGTAFYALGYARATGRPAAWITTSGTAVANGMPAVVEAGIDGVPLLLFTADRPPELRDTSANQTIDQVKLFGEYVRWQFDLPTPTADIDPAAVLTTVDQAVYRCLRTPAGPVHLNCMYRKPLAPEPDAHDIDALFDRVGDWTGRDDPYTRYESDRPGVADQGTERLRGALQRTERGIVIAGRLPASSTAEPIRALASRLGWPLLADVGSGLRLGSSWDDDSTIPYYDQILASKAFRRRYRPEVVLQFGGRFVSKRLLQYVDEARPASYIVVDETPFRHDPSHQVSRRLEADPAALSQAVVDKLPPSPPLSPWTAAWQAASEATNDVLEAYMQDAPSLTEPMAARTVTRALPPDHGLVLANSMPVRDVDRFASTDGPAAPSAANRGASGIDGTVATAAGFSRGQGGPVTLLIGDLALLHDINSLALLENHAYPVTVVVINNGGGGIFSFLPIAHHKDVFEPFFETPHAFSFEHAAAQFNIVYHRPSSQAAFERIYRKTSREEGSSLIEIGTERAANRALHEELEARIDKAISERLNSFPSDQ